ncbi:MAG: efflux RND transporter periplasmic adaptor subunit [Pseudomonadales bacterium]|jgi:multidrug resistance efflux pump|nr:efflux RND transporter periplasmic adaptor subunit [Pseudomonadales bacterium]
MKQEKKVDAAETTKVENGKEKKDKSIVIVIIATLLLIAVAIFGFSFHAQSSSHIVTDNARVTTTLVPIVSLATGTLERDLVTEGQRVETNEVVGWVENGGAIRSPIDGLIVHSSVVQNQIVSPATPVAIVADTSDIHIVANIEEDYILRVQRGQEVVITIDALGRDRFAGYVADIGHITHAELTGSTMFFNTGGTFTRVTHLIPVRINLIDDINLDSLIGVNARVQIQLK